MINPPAFPNSGAHGHTGEYLPEGGMTLRDWFAGQALVATIELVTRDPKLRGLSDKALNERAATIAYGAADAMLVTRSEKNNG